jgi:hypothetical protein
MDSALISCMDLSGHDPTHDRVMLTCGLPDFRLGEDVPEMQCGYQPVSGALIAQPEILRRLRKARPADVGRHS